MEWPCTGRRSRGCGCSCSTTPVARIWPTGASLEKAAELAEKLRQRIMQANFIPDDPLPITASFGVAASHPDENFEDAFRQADEALYLAKSRGRNCVVAAAEDQMHKMTGARKSTWALVSGRFKLHK